jgi:carbamoyl-phosphate synthase large subunit
LCFQAIDTADGPKVFEINARFGGGFPLAHAAGAPFTRWLIAEAAGLSEAPHDEWQEGTTMLRYDEAVFGRSEDPAWRA